jgi:hypothetical protein
VRVPQAFESDPPIAPLVGERGRLGLRCETPHRLEAQAQGGDQMPVGVDARLGDEIARQPSHGVVID